MIVDVQRERQLNVFGQLCASEERIVPVARWIVERHYGAVRSAQSAAAEIVARTASTDGNSELVGGLMGGHEDSPKLTTDEVSALKSLLERL